MTLKLKIWIAIVALAFGLAMAGAAEAATCKTAKRTADQKTPAHTVRVYRGVMPEVVTYSGGYVPPTGRYAGTETASSEPLYDEEPGDDYTYGYGYDYPYYGYWGWPLIVAEQRRFDRFHDNRFRHDGFRGGHVAFHNRRVGFRNGFNGFRGRVGFQTGTTDFLGNTGTGGFLGPTRGGMRR